MTITKEHLKDSLYMNCGLSRKASGELVEHIIEIMKRTLAEGEDILLSGFGKFQVKDKNQRRGRNPATGSDIVLGERRVVTFKCSGLLRDKINSSK